MITIVEALTIDADVFETLFNASYEKMEQGTMPWEILGNPASLEEKKEALLAVFNRSCGWANSKVIVWHKDGVPIHMAAGSIPINDSSYIEWTYAMYGPDANNSKNWLYDAGYIAQTKQFLKEELGVIGYKIACVKDSTLYNYHMNKPSSSTYYDISEEASADGKIAVLRYAYL